MRFVFRLESLLKYRKHRRDVLRAVCADITARKNALLGQREALAGRRTLQIDEIRTLFGEGTFNVDAAVARRTHAGRLGQELVAFDQELQAVDQRLQLCRKELTAAEQDVESLEKLKDRQRREFEYERGRKEQAEIEDVWLSARAAEYTS